MNRLQIWRREAWIALALVAVVAAPFALKPRDTAAPSRYDRRLVIITPHYERIRAEFGRAFARRWKDQTGESLFVDWRVPGGTSEITVMLKSDYLAAFQYHWVHDLGKEWTPAAAAMCLNPKAPADDPVRWEFLNSRVGVGVDVFFGGGGYDFQIQANAGTLVASDGPETGLTAIRKRHPDWFSDAVIPESLSGEIFRDPADRWCGTCLSSFGIVFNRDVLQRLGIEKEPAQWRDLADPRYFGQIALADPGRSASVTKAFEMLIQQEMQREIAALQKNPGKRTPAEVMDDGVRRGWTAGLRLIQEISANARYFSDTSTKITLDVARGDAAAGMCIDFYGRTMEEDLRRPGGTSRVGFVMPVGGTSVSVDPIGLLRGAPEPGCATAFIEFVLSPEGQKLWAYHTGAPGGPTGSALRRLPVRRDFYTQENLQYMPDAAEMPFEKAASFVYHPEWTGSAFSALRFLLRVVCVDTHPEQVAAWRALIDENFPERATQVFHDLNAVRYGIATDTISKTVNSRDKVAETRLARQLGDTFRKSYELARTLAEPRRFNVGSTH
jgi:ABC-type Fe3+ transport system substrate-binding protein